VEISAAIDEFLHVVESPLLTPQERLEQLPGALDTLALAMRDMALVFDEKDYPDAPSGDYQSTYRLVGQHFPTLGYYNTPISITTEVGDSRMGIGDAIDDIVDILLDLKKALWRFKNTSVNDALWELNLLYRSHWGTHLRSLQLYLHVLAIESEKEV
jgi:hypothetical protein